MTLSQNVYFVHLTDLHFQHPEHPDARGAEQTLGTLERAIKMIANLPKRPEFVLFTGDIANFGDVASYRVVEEKLSKLNLPIFYVLGNTDDRTGFHTAQGSSGAQPDALHYFDMLVKDVHVIGLDSCVPDKVWGQIGAEQFEFLDDALERHPGVPKIIALHHPPALPQFPGRAFQSLDQASSERFGAMLEGAEVAAVMCGHIHLNRIVHWKGVPIVSNCGLQGATDPGFDGLRFTTQTGFALHELSGAALMTNFVHLEPEPGEVKSFSNAQLDEFDRV